MRNVLVAASLAVCAAGCATATPPEPSAAPPQPSAAPASGTPERSATVVSVRKYDDYWTYVLACDGDAPTATAYVTVRSTSGEVFSARVSRPRQIVTAPPISPQAPLREIAVLDSIPDGDPLPPLEVGERLTYVPADSVPDFRGPKPRPGASDVPPFGR